MYLHAAGCSHAVMACLTTTRIGHWPAGCCGSACCMAAAQHSSGHPHAPHRRSNPQQHKVHPTWNSNIAQELREPSRMHGACLFHLLCVYAMVVALRQAGLMAFWHSLALNVCPTWSHSIVMLLMRICCHAHNSLCCRCPLCLRVCLPSG